MKNNQYTIRELEASEYGEWDEFVRNSSNGLLFHLSSWADTIKSVTGRPFVITALFKKDVIISGILYWPKEKPLPAITSAPLTFYQGILHKIPSDKKSTSLNADLQERTALLLDYLCTKYSFIEISLSRNTLDTRAYKWKNFNVEPLYTYLIGLTAEEEILKRFSQSLRRKINVSKKQELTVVSSNQNVKIVQFILDSYKHHNTAPPVSPKNIEHFLDKIVKSDMGRIYYLEKDDEYLCGLVVLIDENDVFALFSGIDTRYRDSQYSQFLHASVMLLPEFRGKTFDFLGANTRQFEQFKRSFGGELHTYYKVTYYKNAFIRLMHRFRQSQQHLSRKIRRFAK